MTKSQIKAELRRSACEDRLAILCKSTAFSCACSWKDGDAGQFILNMKKDDWKTFFLLVAEAL